jgi:hypothetical protein
MCVDRFCLGSCADDVDYSYISNAMIALCFASWFDRESLEHFGARRLDHRPVSISVTHSLAPSFPDSLLPILSPSYTISFSYSTLVFRQHCNKVSHYLLPHPFS